MIAWVLVLLMTFSPFVSLGENVTGTWIQNKEENLLAIKAALDQDPQNEMYQYLWTFENNSNIFFNFQDNGVLLIETCEYYQWTLQGNKLTMQMGTPENISQEYTMTYLEQKNKILWKQPGSETEMILEKIEGTTPGLLGKWHFADDETTDYTLFQEDHTVLSVSTVFFQYHTQEDGFLILTDERDDFEMKFSYLLNDEILQLISPDDGSTLYLLERWNKE